MTEPNPTPAGLPVDELEAVARLLAQPPPRPDVVAAARAGLTRAAVSQQRRPGAGHRRNGGRAPGRRRPGGRRWLEWLAPVAAAAAVAGVVAGVMTFSAALQRRPAAQGPAAAFTRVPRYFVALAGGGAADQGQRAVAGATATGAVLGSVAAPRPGSVFTWVAAAGDDRTFVLAAQRSKDRYYTVGPATFYRLVLSRSGRPAHLTPLPIPPQTWDINGFALSPDGSKLAVSVLGPGVPPATSKIEVFSLATGAGRAWTWPGAGFIGWDKPAAQSLSWEADNRTLLFQQRTYTRSGNTIRGAAQVRLLDTAAPGGSILTASTRVPIPSREISGTDAGGLQVSGPLLVTGNGTKVAGPTSTATMHIPAKTHSPQARRLRETITRLLAAYHKELAHHPWPAKITQQAEHRVLQAMQAYRQGGFGPSYTTQVAITEFSVATGKPVLTVGQQNLGTHVGRPDVLWVNATGTVMIAVRPLPKAGTIITPTVIGVQARNAFTPLPAPIQHYHLAGLQTLAW